MKSKQNGPMHSHPLERWRFIIAVAEISFLGVAFLGGWSFHLSSDANCRHASFEAKAATHESDNNSRVAIHDLPSISTENLSKQPPPDQNQKEHLDGVALFGTRTVDGGRNAAIISINGGTQRVFREGQAITPEMALEAVFAEYIEIRRGLQVTRVPFQSAPNSSHAWQTPNKIAPNAFLSGRGTFASVTELRAGLNEVEFAVYQYPYWGKVLTVTGAKTQSSLLEVGLEIGDIIFKENGEQIRSRSELLGLAKMLTARTQMKIKVYRPKRDQFYSISLG